ncbi:cell division protein FtsQ/DivIB [Acidocella sp.]|uniref:cell division protein FtsQ/DivIB n=1 Tax=Acidocella sp. TaxID=50710 RepID=UPI002614D767|nr:cell division protein FtsQ/DivIB [Acidocella sp.]
MSSGPPRARARKPAPQPDRLSARKLYWRRVKRSLKPGLWLLGLGVLGVGASEALHSLPARQAAATVPSTASAAPAAPHRGLGGLLAWLGFRVQNIDIEGADPDDLLAIQAAVGVAPGAPIFGPSLSAIQARIQDLGPVEGATVERVLPSTLVIEVAERNALAIWQTQTQGQTRFVVIDKQGDVILGQDAAQAKRREPGLLLLTGPDAPEHAAALINALKAAPSVAAQVVAAERVDGLRWNLILKDQAVVKLPGSADEAAAIGQLAALESSLNLLERPVEDIDLRQPGRLVVRPYPAPAGPDAGKSKPGGATP